MNLCGKRINKISLKNINPKMLMAAIFLHKINL
jgi:hypothetical protein